MDENIKQFSRHVEIDFFYGIFPLFEKAGFRAP